MLFNLQNELDILKAQTAFKGFLERGDTIELKQFKDEFRRSITESTINSRKVSECTIDRG